MIIEEILRLLHALTVVVTINTAGFAIAAVIVWLLH